MTEPTRRTSKTTTTTTAAATRAAAGRSGDHAPDQDHTPEPLPIPRLGDSETARRRKPLRGTGAVYQQIAADIRARIDSGELAPGQAIPSESQMMEQFGVSRPTVRQAVGALRSAGLLVVQRGRATTVRPSISATDGQLAFSPSITRTRKKTGSTFRTWDAQGWDDVEEPSRYRTEVAQYAQVLQLAPGEPVFGLDRQLQHADTGTEITHRTYLPFATAADIPALEADPFQQPADLYQVLTEAGHTLHWNDSITTAMPTPDEAATLDIPDGVPLLIHTRTTLNQHNRPLLIEETHLPGDRIRITSANP